MARRLAVMTSLVGSGGTQRQQRTKNGRNKRRVALSEGLPAVSIQLSAAGLPGYLKQALRRGWLHLRPE